MSQATHDIGHILRRARFRAWHRGTREADYMIGGFFDRYHATWTQEEALWFERFLDEEDVDIMGWAMDRQPVPEQWQGPLMAAFQKLDFIDIPR
ncbi:succinate dehydrogenase assembly factor 2 [Sphingobium sufflavum]|uniref:succinate dehydrogenase assembly factor 2 n=1 Tax=Sphingobium sufflavum TaxID=1129547 RepID=UPI001F40BFE1|nr:succinate dehydrogenase assembly factor 2 [Sphingobium sufflavum]MCE7798216.1 succinate dehydrogenase assembly factor 2 [Sphingobium sufflavum]